MNAIDTAIRLFMAERVISYVSGDTIPEEYSKGVSIDVFKFSKLYRDYLLRSMESLQFEQEDIVDFKKSWRQYRKKLNSFLKMSGGRRPMTPAKYADLFVKVEKDCEKLQFWEQSIKKRFIEDWGQKLSYVEGSLGVDVLKEGRYKNFAIIVQATKSFDFAYPGRGKVVACSLFTDSIQNLYDNRLYGYVFSLQHQDLVCVSSGDAQTHFYFIGNFFGISYEAASFGNG